MVMELLHFLVVIRTNLDGYWRNVNKYFSVFNIMFEDLHLFWRQVFEDFLSTR